MTAKLAKWGLIGVLIAGLCWASYQWGASSERAEVEQEMAEAAQQAVKAAKKEWKSKLEAAEQRAEAHRRRIETMRAELRERRDALAAYRETDDAGETCFEGRSLDLFNAF